VRLLGKQRLPTPFFSPFLPLEKQRQNNYIGLIFCYAGTHMQTALKIVRRLLPTPIKPRSNKAAQLWVPLRQQCSGD